MRRTRTDCWSDRGGFTLVELAIVLIIASVLIGMAVPRIQSSFHQRDVNGARDGVLLLAARARARAMEQAQTVSFELRADDGYAAVVQAGDTVEIFRFGEEFGVTADSDVPVLTMCYTPRGYATQPCSTSLAEPVEVQFSRAEATAGLEVWQLGQLRKL